MKLDTFTTAYIEAALWSSTDDDGTPLDSNYSIEDIAPDCLARMIAACLHFQARVGDKITSDLARAGHDFWLTRNGHGAGFWDGDWPEHGDTLTEASKLYPEFNLYVGDDGKLHA